MEFAAQRGHIVPTHVGVDRRQRGESPILGIIVPTHVGVDRGAGSFDVVSTHRPHARGGGPRRSSAAANKPASSPRTWGWTANQGGELVEHTIVPTHVGVDRAEGGVAVPWPHRPHARGGGPASARYLIRAN